MKASPEKCVPLVVTPKYRLVYYCWLFPLIHTAFFHFLVIYNTKQQYLHKAFVMNNNQSKWGACLDYRTIFLHDWQNQQLITTLSVDQPRLHWVCHVHLSIPMLSKCTKIIASIYMLYFQLQAGGSEWWRKRPQRPHADMTDGPLVKFIVNKEIHTLSHKIINRPGVAGAVLQIALLLINWFIN